MNRETKEIIPQELLVSGVGLTRLENTEQMTMAIQRPRDEAAILKAALDELELYPSCAEEAIYIKPVGQDYQTQEQKYVEGLSIRAAENLANRFVNSSYGCEIVQEDEEKATLVAVFLDLERNTRHMLSKTVSKFYKARTGGIQQYPPDRFADIVVPAHRSKLLREVILRSLPSGLRREYEIKAREILVAASSGKDFNERMTAMKIKFTSFGITSPMLETLRGKKLSEFTADDIVELRGIYNSLKDGETTVESLFADFKKDESPEEPEPELKPKKGKNKEEDKS